jgi:hypothetical protein
VPVRALLMAGLVALAGCAGITPPKRHSPAEIATYSADTFVAPIASTAGERSEFNAATDKIRLALAQPGNTALAAEALDAILFMNTDHESGRILLAATLPVLGSRPPDEQRAVLSVAHAMYGDESAAQLRQLLPQLTTPREFCIAAYTILKADSSPGTRAALLETLLVRFPESLNEPRLRALMHALTADAAAELKARPPLADLLAAPFRSAGPDLPVVVSFQRPGRRVFGLAMVRGADGRFARNADGSYFAIPHLARALTALPGTITNGNTPQGLFTIVGAGTATNRWIGPTPYLESKVPYEATVGEFAHADIAGEWSESLYESYLPASWRSYAPFKEAFLAGQAGRNEMLIHGTTINSNYYAGASYFPGTPSAGCLVAMETWDPADGRMRSSNQLTLAKVFTRTGTDRGYLIVVEIDDRAEPVDLAEVLPAVERAQAMGRTVAVVQP